ncbi:MAG: hypothetical protein ACP5UL_05565 [Thermoplasmata archaeon]
MLKEHLTDRCYEHIEDIHLNMINYRCINRIIEKENMTNSYYYLTVSMYVAHNGFGSIPARGYNSQFKIRYG